MSTKSLITPGTAEVTADGVLSLAGADLDYADLGGACRLAVNALTQTLTIKHGTSHRVHADGPRGLVNAKSELRALGALITLASDPVAAKVVRHSDGHTRWLVLRFPPEAMKKKARKNKGR